MIRTRLYVGILIAARKRLEMFNQRVRRAGTCFFDGKSGFGMF